MISLPIDRSQGSDPVEIPPFDADNAAVLIVDDEPQVRAQLEQVLRPYFACVACASGYHEARGLAQQTRFDCLIAEIELPGTTTGIDLAAQLRASGNTDMDVILLTRRRDLGATLDALPKETTDVVNKPLQIEHLLGVIARARSRTPGESAHEPPPTAARIIGESDTIKQIWQTIGRVAPTPSTVLIKGETGTGKELVARALHEISGRRGAYVPVNCGAISPDLIEGELFGHLKGAFTGAHQTRSGLFGHADGGTLFLDEIGEMPLALQAKLLRVLEEKSYRPVGGNQEIPVNARMIAATNRDLAAEVLAGRFRKDLYYRINVVEIRLPPLRERKNDIPRLTSYFLASLADELGVRVPRLDSAELGRLIGYHWPGNIRELRNVIERALLLGTPPSSFLADDDPLAHDDGAAPTATQPQSLEDVQRAHILNALLAAGGNKTVAARNLGVSRKTVERKLKEWAENCPTSEAV